MFERFTESARRVLFFARYEASQLGATSIDSDHILLGLMRDCKGVVAEVLSAYNVSAKRIRTDMESRSVFREKVSTSVELPFTIAARRVLEITLKEADGLHHSYIGTEHLLLGLLHEEGETGTLRSYGMRIDEVRTKIVDLLGQGAGEGATVGPAIAHIDSLKDLVQQLTETPFGSTESRGVAVLIQQKLDELKRYFS